MGLEKQSIFCGDKSSITTDLRRVQIFCNLWVEKSRSVNTKGVKPTELVAHKELEMNHSELLIKKKYLHFLKSRLFFAARELY